MAYACACVSDCLRLRIFAWTHLLGTLLGAAGSNVGVRHEEMEIVRELRSLWECEMKLLERSGRVDGRM